MRLSELALERRYRRDRSNLRDAFYAPCLRASKRYWRAAGYFSSSILQSLTSDLLDLANRGGQLRIVASPHLSEDDVREIKAAYERRHEVIASALERQIAAAAEAPDEDQDFGILGFLIERGILDIKIAVVNDGSGELGLYHEKFGIFIDENDDYVAFSGSANESYNGLVSNFESINVFCSWKDRDNDRAQEHLMDFESLWRNDTEALEVLDFPQAAHQQLIESYKRTRTAARSGPQSPPPLTAGYGFPHLPSDFSLRNYQDEAIKAWAEAGGRGILAMATGTGKTATTLAMLTRIAATTQNENRPFLAVVTCPFMNLVDQWAEEAERFGIVAVKCYQQRSVWQPRAEALVGSLSRATVKFGMLICTNDTLRSEPFQLIMATATCTSMFIADEVHNLGAEFNASSLPQHMGMRLGLSATPERWFDELGTSRITSYFGEVVYRLTLEQAINLKALTPYKYFPKLVSLTHDELHDYLSLSTQIQRAASIAAADSEALDDNPQLKLLLIKRARLLTGACNKLPALSDALRPYAATSHNLIYAAEGRPQGSDDTDEADYRNIDATLSVVGNDVGMRADIYTSNTASSERRRILDRFRSGDLQAVIAMRCLDEGVDVPVARRAFILASSSNPRQFVQRRGRILRRADNKEYAEIFDFIVVPPKERLAPESFNFERRLLRGELRRVVEFASMAQNGPVALNQLLSIRSEYNLLDVG